MILFTQPSAVSVTAAKWIDSWARLQFRFFLNLFSCLLTTNLSQNDRSRAGLPKNFNFGRNGNRQWIPITFHVYSRYLAATRDVHSTATGCKWLTFRFTTIMQRNQSAHTLLIDVINANTSSWRKLLSLRVTAQNPAIPYRFQAYLKKKKIYIYICNIYIKNRKFLYWFF